MVEVEAAYFATILICHGQQLLCISANLNTPKQCSRTNKTYCRQLRVALTFHCFSEKLLKLSNIWPWQNTPSR